MPDEDDEPDDVPGEPSVEFSHENNGRGIVLDTGFYRVELFGDASDDIEDVVEAAFEVADRAKEDAAELDDRIEDDGRHYR